MKRYRRRVLLVPAVLVALVWVLLWRHPAHRGDDPAYAVIALQIGLIAAVSVLSQLWRTTSWTVRAMGVLGYVAGGAVLYLLIASDHWELTQRGWHEGITDLAAAILIVGGPLLLWGLIETTVDDRRIETPLRRLEKTTDRNVALSHTLEHVAAQQETRGAEQDQRETAQNARDDADTGAAPCEDSS